MIVVILTFMQFIQKQQHAQNFKRKAVKNGKIVL